MEKMDIITNIIKMVFINACVSYISCRIINYKTKSFIKIGLLTLVAVNISLIYSLLINYMNPINLLLISYIIFSIVFSYITGNKLSNSIVITVMAISITYIIYIVSVMSAGVIIYLLKISDNFGSRSNFIVISIIEILLIMLLFKSRRFKNGFNFIKTNSKSLDIISYSTLLCMIIIATYILIRSYINDDVNAVLFTFIVFLAVNFILWLRTEITKQYRKNMIDRTIEVQKKEIDEQLNIIKDIKEENFRLAKVIHKYNNRLFALELGIKNTIEQNYKTEFAEELSSILEETENISKGFSEETTIKNKTLPLTNITGIDNMFKYMQKEASRSNINFDLKINESINSLIENTISKEKLETLIGDHLKDAIIAVNSSDNSYKSILAILGRIEDCYELSVYDTGIEFDIEVLLKLGIEPITTHKETGGSGIGFMTTFETLKECRASLIIEEYNPETTNYTKSVTIRFDNNNEYKIRSYRAKEIRKLNKDKRIIIENI